MGSDTAVCSTTTGQKNHPIRLFGYTYITSASGLLNAVSTTLPHLKADASVLSQNVQYVENHKRLPTAS